MVYTLSPILSAPRRRSVVVTKLRVWTARLEDRRPAGSAAPTGGDSVAIATVRRRRHFGTPRKACMLGLPGSLGHQFVSMHDAGLPGRQRGYTAWGGLTE